MSLKMILAVGPLFFAAAAAFAQDDANTRPIGLPTNLTDNSGATYVVYANGMVQQQGGNVPLFGQLGQFNLNGQAPNANRINFPGNPGNPNFPGNNAAPSSRVDDRTGEIILSNLQIAGFTVSRRILLDKESATLRFVDTYRNPSAGEKIANINYTNNFNFGIQSSRSVVPSDAKKPNQPLGWAGLTGNNRAVYTAWGLTGGKAVPRINYPEGSNTLSVAYALTLPANKEMTLVHYHGSAENVDKAAAEITAARFTKFTNTLPEIVRRSLANIPGRGGFLPDDLELLRGEQTDIIETTTGDLLRGSFRDKTFPVTTFFGRIDLPADKVLSILTIGRQRPMHLLVTNEGELFGGTLDLPALTFELASGQTIKLPLSQFRRAGARRSNMTDAEGNEPASARKPVIQLRNGQRLAIVAPTAPLDFASRYGPLSVPANKIAQLSLFSPASPVHQVLLTDGSKFSAILLAPKFDLTLDGAVGAKAVSVPTSLIATLEPTAAANDDDDTASPSGSPQLRTAGDDVFVGTLSGILQLDTAFETLDIPTDGIRSIRRAGEADAATFSAELKITQWDGTQITGTPKAPTLALSLSSGLSVAIPVDLLLSFDNPKPRPTGAMTERVKALVAKLNDDDFKTREKAQAELLATGPAIAPLLRELRDAKPAPTPEVQQRLDTLLSQLEK